MNDRTDGDRIKELENRLSDLRRRLPAHSVPPSMMEVLEGLEEELGAARRGEGE